MNIDIIGDIHGCFAEFEELTKQLGYAWNEGLPIHPEGRILGFVGDLTDRGPNSVKVIETVHDLWERQLAYYVPGNHCNKLYRMFLGNNVKINNGLETTVAELNELNNRDYKRVKKKFMTLYEQSPLYQVLDDGQLIIAHAGIKESYIGKYTSKVKTFVLYGDITGGTDPDGYPTRRDWAKTYSGKPWIVYGHTPVREARFVNHTANIDTGAVFGGQLSAFRYPEKDVLSVPSSMPHVPEKFRPIPD
ncbi:bis(5'-nucleosyl)-tetraphosphatase PrpE [Bacillus thermotolerans]|uniref:bis(5'-nucleosyl)-tetraphosphatase PrpE n=1 Tax=Bacillus thermotolerans TaxID=1221996 RepID=UPI000589679F|nr:bis(5'-nucleosyl)-tetraphosphatase PrpE [Bacillus thermotolerans]KKB41649.1 Diadenosine tetraphosphatase [Bacillus thermotolerans]